MINYFKLKLLDEINCKQIYEYKWISMCDFKSTNKKNNLFLCATYKLVA